MSSPLTTLAMGAISAGGTIAQGNYQYEVAKAEQKQLGRMASEELAVATRGAEAAAKEGRLLTSRGQTVAASSGGMATDDSVLNLIGGIAQETSVRTRGNLREGQVKADDLLYRGRVGRAGAKFQRGLSRWEAAGTMLSAASKAAEQVAGAATGTPVANSGFSGAFAKYGSGIPTYEVSPSQQSPWYQ
jgi:hypothetical protein